jgi:hypothetical protein
MSHELVAPLHAGAELADRVVHGGYAAVVCHHTDCEIRMIHHPEVGKRLAADELQVGTIVVVIPPSTLFPPVDKPSLLFPVMVTVWVHAIEPGIVVFKAGDPPLFVISGIEDNKVYDDQRREVCIYEYLGEP